MFHLKDSPLHGSVFALAVSSLALLGSLLFRPLLEPNFYLPSLAAVIASAWYYGRVGGYTATVLSTAGVGFLLLRLHGPLYAGGLNVAIGIAAYMAIAAGITAVTSGWITSRSMLNATLSSIGDGVLATDREQRITFLNPVAELLTGWRRAEALRKPLSEVLVVVEEGSREPAENLVTKALRDGVTAHGSGQILLIARDKAEISIEQSAAPLDDERGRLRGAILVLRDVRSRRQLEEQLGQASKMDAVGRLAGGVAGDFNNVLTVIAGYSELLRSQLPGSSPLRRFADEIQHAGERAAGLTRQLLAFSRAQSSQPKVADLNALLAGMEPMLRRVLGDRIELIVLPGPSLGRVRIDAPQMQQAILNLATNAREAMPKGGRVVVETAQVEMEESTAKKAGLKPGPYILMAVSDTGMGMDAETRSRLFEPFFTTKEQGKGSGLGLSLVYGTVKQADGEITVYSQVNCGTIFEIYLPRVTERIETPVPRKQVVSKGSETILVVDDEDSIRSLVHAILEDGGYEVLEANNGVAALLQYEKNAHKIDLVLTDVVMPQMNGIELGERLIAKDPGLAILYMSGYRDSQVSGTTGGQVVKEFLNKPFTPDVVLAKVREVLDARRA